MFGSSFSWDKMNIWNIASLSENKISSLLKDKNKLIKHHQKNFSRVYPAGLRVDSSNYNPMESFFTGCQIIALNFQTPDFPMLLNLSFFEKNGGSKSGYILKPNYMLHDSSEILSNEIKVKIDLKIISAQHLGINPKVDTSPYINVFLAGFDDEKNNYFTTKHVASMLIFFE